MAALQKWNRNAIVEAIQAVGLDPLVFDLGDDDGIVRIKHKWSPSRFTIRDDGAYYDARYVVGDGAEWPVGAYTWGTILPRISTWLKEVKLDIDTPDLWAELQRETKLVEAGSNELTENTLFTPEEQKEIAERLRELAKNARQTYGLSETQMQALDQKLDYLIDASGRLGRKDWLNAFIGVTLGYILGAALPPESARTTFQTFLRAVGLLYPELPLIE